jgi:hypothetical protein
MRLYEFKNIISENFKEDEFDENLYRIENDIKLKTKVKSIIKSILDKDEDFLYDIASAFVWRDGSNGYISFDKLNHYINDLAYRTYADAPHLFDGNLSLSKIERIKDQVYYTGDLVRGDSEKGQEFITRTNWVYNPDDEFRW